MILKSSLSRSKVARVLFLHHEASNTGSSRLLLDLLKYLHSQNPEFSPVLCFYRGGALLDDFVSLGFPVFVFDPDKNQSRKKSKFERMAGLLWFSTVLIRVHPALLYANTVMTSTSVLVAGCAGIRTLVHVHEGPRYLDRIGAGLRLSASLTDRFVAVSEYCANGIREVLKRSASVVRNWTPLEEKEIPEGGRIAESGIVVGIVGTVDRNKHHLLALMSVASLRESASRPVRIRVVGPIADMEYAKELERAATLLGVSDLVEFAGAAPNPEVIYPLLDMVLITSMEETFSLVALEAARYRKTIVAADVGGIREAITKDARAFFFRAGDWKSLRAALQDALSGQAALGTQDQRFPAAHAGAAAMTLHGGPQRLLELIRFELAV